MLPWDDKKSTLTPAQARAEIAKVERDQALYDADAPGHKALVRKRDESHRIAYPE